MTTAVSDMETAYTAAAGRTIPDEIDLGAGDITGMTLTPGLYKWGTGVLISAGGVTLSGTSSEVWIFQIAQDLTVANGAIVTLSGGARASNIFWQVAGQTTLGTTSDFKGIILCQTLIEIQTGAMLEGRALAQTAVTLDADTITAPSDLPIDNIPPTVSSTIPANLATGVAINSAMSATFSEAMDPLTITTATFTLKQGITPISGAVTYSGVTAVFTPDDNLTHSTVYTATITTGAEDLAGNAIASNYMWNFTTGAALDTTAPGVSSTIPAYGISGVSANTKISATFNENMNPLTITTTTFTLTKQGAAAVSGTVTYSGVTAVFTPASNLVSGAAYTATITIGVKDLAGNAMPSEYSWSFRVATVATTDTTRPTVSSTIPANSATGVLINAKISATFSEAMDPLTITTITFTLKQGTTAVSGTVTYSSVTATFTPASNLAYSTVYTATITTGVRDLAGNSLAVNKVWTFTTGAAPVALDTTAPTVSSTIPANLATGLAANSAMSATFSEAMDPLTITTATFTLKRGSTPVLGAVTYSGVTAVFKPTSNLAASTTYTATITTGAKDLAGNALAVNKVWTFTTGATPDTTAPIISILNPADAATGLAVDGAIAAVFSENIDPLTVTTATFTLMQGDTPVSGTVTYEGVTATFTPTVPLAPGTEYTATITTGAEDLAGNPLASDRTWTFTTVAAPASAGFPIWATTLIIVGVAGAAAAAVFLLGKKRSEK
jgi:hypothetical protein